MADDFKQHLPPKKVDEADDCTECGHPFSEHKVYPGGKCAQCHDKKKGFGCNGFNLGMTVGYDNEPDELTGKPWKVRIIPGKLLKNGKQPQN